MNDFELIRQCVDKDKKTWDLFVEKFSRLIYDSIIQTFKCYGRYVETGSVADLHNDIFLFLLENDCRALRAFRGANGCKLSHYLRTIAVRKTIDYLRRLKPNCQLTIDDEEDALTEPAEKSDAVYAMMEQEEMVEIMKELLGQLRDDEAHLCRMFFYEDKSPQSIARELGISVDYFYVSKKRILNKLKTMADQKGIQI